jgi:hypothetical protein
LPRSDILLDSNAYFRLADNLYPVLDKPFGFNPVYKLWILGFTEKEYLKSPRLQTKFEWCENDKHREERKRNTLKCKKEKLAVIDRTYHFMKQASLDSGFTCSPIDIKYLAWAYELGILLVTDDKDLSLLAEEFDVKHTSTLGLLKMKLDAGSITLQEIQGTVYYWRYQADLPRNFRNDFLTLFGIEPE